MPSSVVIEDPRNPNYLPCAFTPLEAFSDGLCSDEVTASVMAHRTHKCGRDSSIVTGVFMSRCAGFRNPPCAGELYDAMRSENPTDREMFVLNTWVRDAKERDWFLAWCEQAYSWRMLVRAVQRSGFLRWEDLRTLNMFAERPDLVPPGAWPVERVNNG